MRSRASTSSSMPIGCVRNSLAPARIACRISWPSLLLLTTRMLHSGDDSRRVLDQLHGLVGVGIDADHADVRSCLADDVGEELVPRRLGLQPAHVHAQEHGLQRLSSRIVGIDDGQAKNICHGGDTFCKSNVLNDSRQVLTTLVTSSDRIPPGRSASGLRCSSPCTVARTGPADLSGRLSRLRSASLAGRPGRSIQRLAARGSGSECRVDRPGQARSSPSGIPWPCLGTAGNRCRHRSTWELPCIRGNTTRTSLGEVVASPGPQGGSSSGSLASMNSGVTMINSSTSFVVSSTRRKGTPNQGRSASHGMPRFCDSVRSGSSLPTPASGPPSSPRPCRPSGCARPER